MATERKHVVERVQTGVRMEKRLLKVLRAFADFNDITLGDLLEGIVLHAFDGKCPFSKNSLERIRELKKFYGLELDSSASHLLIETDAPYLAPAPFRGKQNYPAYVKLVAQKLADVRNTSIEHIAEVSKNNFYRVFHPCQ